MGGACWVVIHGLKKTARERETDRQTDRERGENKNKKHVNCSEMSSTFFKIITFLCVINGGVNHLGAIIHSTLDTSIAPTRNSLALD